MKLKLADLKTRQEAEHRMIDGEVFRFLDNEFLYDRENSQFVVYKDGYIERIKSYWDTITEWQVEVPRTWEDDVREGRPIDCRVSNYPVSGQFRTRRIVRIGCTGFVDEDAYSWISATPITPDDPAIYKGEK